jgi:hypothetical protein
MSHHLVPQNFSRNLPEIIGVDVVFHLPDYCFDLLGAYRTFVTGLFQTAADFIRIERFPSAVFLYYLERYIFYLLHGPDTAFTAVAHPPAADGKTVPLQPGIRHREIAFTTKGTFHTGWIYPG